MSNFNRPPKGESGPVMREGVNITDVWAAQKAVKENWDLMNRCFLLAGQARYAAEKSEVPPEEVAELQRIGAEAKEMGETAMRQGQELDARLMSFYEQPITPPRGEGPSSLSLAQDLRNLDKKASEDNE